MNLNTTDQTALETGAPVPRTHVLLCQALSDLGSGLDLAVIKQALSDVPGLRVEIVPDLCHNPKALVETSEESEDRVVLGLCSGDSSGREIDYHARQAGLDPFGVARVNLGGLCALAHPSETATNKATTLVSAAVAKARAFEGSGPEHVKPHLGWSEQKVSRRALFTLPPITYQPVASVRSDRCLSEAGCDLCTTVCPRGALSVIDGKLRLDKSGCDASGLCITSCPRDALELPAASLREYEVELEELLTAPGLPLEPRAILYVCDRNARVLEDLTKERHSYPANWLPVTVPCTGMISPGWILQALALGASAVGIVACGGACTFNQYERTAATVDYCQELLERLGMSPDALRVSSPTSLAALAEVLDRPLEGGWRPDGRASRSACLREPTATAGALAQFTTARDEMPLLVLSHELSPLGNVRIDVDGCTACESCVRACPTGALASERDDVGLAFTFDPNLCTGCSLCARWCPEDVLQVEHITDLGVLSSGRTELYRDTQVRCERCGVAFAPASMVRRVEQLLEGGGTTQAIRRCPSCRGLAIGATLARHVQSDQPKEE